jgi:hypothetical protein
MGGKVMGNIVPFFRAVVFPPPDMFPGDEVVLPSPNLLGLISGGDTLGTASYQGDELGILG